MCLFSKLSLRQWNVDAMFCCKTFSSAASTELLKWILKFFSNNCGNSHKIILPRRNQRRIPYVDSNEWPTRKSSCVKMEEAYHPRHILSIVFPAWAAGGGGVLCPVAGLGGTLSWLGGYTVLVLVGGRGWGYPVLVLAGSRAVVGVLCTGPGWGRGPPPHLLSSQERTWDQRPVSRVPPLPPKWTDKQTENITSRRTSYADGKKNVKTSVITTFL